MCVLETSNSFGFHASALLSAYPTLIWLCPRSPLLLNTIQTQGGPQLLTALCGRPHRASQSRVAARLGFRAISLQSRLHLNRGKSSVRKNKSSMSLSPWCPIKSCYTAQMLHSHLAFQEIITDWEENILWLWVSRSLRLCGCQCYVYMCPCVLAAGANMSRTWSMLVRTHSSHRPHDYTAIL